MSTLQLTPYPLDLSGIQPSNLIAAEQRTLPAARLRVVAPAAGPFFSTSMVVKDSATQATLTREVDYQCLHLAKVPTELSGQAVCTIVLILNPSVGAEVTLSYQAVGGAYGRSADTAAQLLQQLLRQERSTSWPTLRNRPASFEALAHLQPWQSAVGLEYVLHEIESLRQVLLLGDEQAHDEILQYLDTRLQGLPDELDASKVPAVAALRTQLKTQQTTLQTQSTQVTALATAASAAQADAQSAHQLAQSLSGTHAGLLVQARELLAGLPNWNQWQTSDFSLSWEVSGGAQLLGLNNLSGRLIPMDRIVYQCTAPDATEYELYEIPMVVPVIGLGDRITFSGATVGDATFARAFKVHYYLSSGQVLTVAGDSGVVRGMSLAFEPRLLGASDVASAQIVRGAPYNDRAINFSNASNRLVVISRIEYTQWDALTRGAQRLNVPVGNAILRPGDASTVSDLAVNNPGYATLFCLRWWLDNGQVFVYTGQNGGLLSAHLLTRGLRSN